MTAVQTIRQDGAGEKRVELHLHTAASDPLALTSAREAVKRAEAWGHRAIAVTDHASVAALQEARSAAEHIKVICGMEAYCIGDEEYSYSHPVHLTLLAKNQQGLLQNRTFKNGHEKKVVEGCTGSSSPQLFEDRFSACWA